MEVLGMMVLVSVIVAGYAARRSIGWRNVWNELRMKYLPAHGDLADEIADLISEVIMNPDKQIRFGEALVVPWVYVHLRLDSALKIQLEHALPVLHTAVADRVQHDVCRRLGRSDTPEGWDPKNFKILLHEGNKQIRITTDTVDDPFASAQVSPHTAPVADRRHGAVPTIQGHQLPRIHPASPVNTRDVPTEQMRYARLELTERGLPTAQIFAYDGQVVLIGRDENCDLRLPHRVPGLSERHLMVRLSGEQLVVTDMSTYGSYIDGRRMAEIERLPIGTVIDLQSTGRTRLAASLCD